MKKLLLLCALVLGLVLMAGPAMGVVFDQCQNDLGLVDDVPGDGQKDLTRFCREPGDLTYDLYTKWNWDEISITNTADACSLYDTNGDINVDLAICVTWWIDSKNNNQITWNTRLFTCDNSKPQNCAGYSQITAVNTDCNVFRSNDDPFGGDGSPQDMTAECNIDLDDFVGVDITSANLLDACTYTSESLLSVASDCIIYSECDDPSDCADTIACTLNECDSTGHCKITPDNSACSNQLFCDGNEVCQIGSGCVSGTAPVVDDEVVCTDDSCNEASDTILHTPNNAFCPDNGDFCDGAPTCDPLNGDPTTGCTAGTAPDVDDGMPCTDDACDEASNTITHTPNDGFCGGNGQWCDGESICDPLNGDSTTGCTDGTAPVTDDGVACTDDSCDEINDVVVHAPNNGFCSDNDVCNGVETCDPTTGCTNPTDLVCDNEQFCDGLETCDPIAGCQDGTAPDCDDTNICTTDTCDEQTDVCKHENSGLCLSGASLTPTDVTCVMYRDNIAPTTYYDHFNYVTKKGLISGISPGVVFYYNTITAAAPDFTLDVEQMNSQNWNDMLVQQNKGKLQAYLYDYTTCKPLLTLTPDSISSTDPYTVTFNIDGATVGNQYIIGIKYTSSSLVKQNPTGASSLYHFQTAIDEVYGTDASWWVLPK